MKKWEVKGYAGFHDYDDERDYNFKHIFEMDDQITKHDIEFMIQSRYRNQRVLVYEVQRVEGEQEMEEKKMQLHGSVVLDDQSMEVLTEQIRKEVVASMESTCSSDEIVQLLLNFGSETYLKILWSTIGEMIQKEENNSWKSEQRLAKLHAIYNILQI